MSKSPGNCLFVLFNALLCFQGLYADDPKLLEEGIAAVKNGDSETAIRNFTRAAASRDIRIAAAAHYNYGTLLAIAAQSESESTAKREMLTRAESSLKRSWQLYPDDRTQKNLYRVRQELLAIPPGQKSENDKDGDSSDPSEKNRDDKNSNEMEQESTREDTAGTDGKEQDEDGSDEENAMNETDRILEKEERDRAQRFLESSGGVNDVQMDW